MTPPAAPARPAGPRLLRLAGLAVALGLPLAAWQVALRATVRAELPALAGDDAAARAVALARLDALRPASLPLLVSAFRAGAADAAPGRAREGGPLTLPVMSALRELGGPDTIECLVSALDDADPDVRHFAGMTLAWIGPDAVPALVDALRHDPDGHGRTSAAWVLSFMASAGRPALPALRDALEDPVKDVRYTARYAIRQLSDPDDPFFRAVEQARAGDGR